MKNLLKRRQRYAILKLIALLSLVRWYNILTVILAQYLAAIFIMNRGAAALEVLSNPFLHLLVCSSAFIISAGFIINSFYDLERDTINRPKEVVFNRLITQQSCLNLYFLFFTIGMLISFSISKQVMLFNFLFSVGLWLYSHKFKKRALTGNIAATVLSVTPFLIVVLFYRDINYAIFFYVAFIAVITLIREVVKDILSQKGDEVMGYASLPLKRGMHVTKRILFVLMLCSILPPVLLYITYDVDLVIVYFAVSIIMVGVSAVFLAKAKTDKDFQRINSMYKAIILLGIFSIILV